LVEKNIAYRMNLYSNDRIHYISKQKLLWIGPNIS
jgi:hypothetical protein